MEIELCSEYGDPNGDLKKLGLVVVIKQRLGMIWNKTYG